MSNVQPGILATENQLARYLTFSISDNTQLNNCLQALNEIADGKTVVVGLGQSLTSALGIEVSGLRTFPASTGKGIEIPSTPNALWIWIRGTGRGEIFLQSCLLESILLPAFVLNETIDSFCFREGRDITGYIDGTENPKDEEAIEAAIVKNQSIEIDGSSFVAVQQWLHNMEAFNAMSETAQDNSIGRRLSDNEELDDAPPSAHVRRTAQEDFEPEAFILRRSMPWVDDMNTGLYFVAFGKSFEAFEAQLNRMTGVDDGINDALFNFTRPVTGSYYWCPPINKENRLNLGLLGI